RFLHVGRYGREVLGQIGLGTAVVEEPVPTGQRIFQSFLSAERLRLNNKQRGGRVEAAQNFGNVRTIDIGQVMNVQAAVPVGLERTGRQFRAQKGPADANRDHIGKGFVGVTASLVAADVLAEF